MAAPIRILVADDHPLIRVGLGAMIEVEPDMRMIGEAADGEKAVELYREHLPDIVLMDLRMPVMDGFSATVAILGEFRDARIIAFTSYDGDEDIHRALSAGARGYLLKYMPRTELLSVIRTVHGGQRGIPPPVAARLAEHTPHVSLTRREIEVLELMARGHSNREMARTLCRSEGTMKAHVRNILEKLDVHGRTAAVKVALRRGFLPLD